MPDTQETLDGLLTYLRQRLPAGTEVEADSKLWVGGRLDSMGVIDLMLFVEKAFGVSLFNAPPDPETMDTVGALAGTIARMQGEKTP